MNYVGPRAWTTEGNMIYGVVPFVDHYNGELLCAKGLKWVDMLDFKATGIYTPLLIMECSEMVDSNETFIYDGDFISITDGQKTFTYVIRHELAGFLVCGRGQHYDTDNLKAVIKVASDLGLKIEVIGNICENFELYEEVDNNG